MHNAFVIDELTRQLQDDPRIAAAVLFGSFARGTPRADSDIDVAVLAVDAAARASLAAAYHQRLGDLGTALARDVHLIDFESTDPALRRTIVARGVALFDRSAGALDRARARALIDYFDGEYMRRVIDAAQRRQLDTARG
ncbi:MAG: nucleotidyltransferase domain-containing protein [Gammaproteobacteria bacterium]